MYVGVVIAGPYSGAHLNPAVTLGLALAGKFAWALVPQYVLAQLLGRGYYTAEDGRIKSTFSNYVQLEYPVWQKGSASLRLFAGGAFAFEREQNFYSNHPNFTNVGGVYAKTLKLGTYEVPVAATGIWNPEKDCGALQVAVTLF